MAAALLALNQVFGDCYDVEAAEVDDPLAFEEKWPKDQFIFDVQTHHVDIARKWYDDTPTGRQIKSFFERLRPGARTREESLELLNRAHYVKEIFGDSDTVMAIISGVPSRDWSKNPLPPTRWSPPARSSTSSPARAGSCRTACSAPTSAPPSSTRWSGR